MSQCEITSTCCLLKKARHTLAAAQRSSLTLFAWHSDLVAAVAPLVLLDLLQLVVVESHALLDSLLFVFVRATGGHNTE